MFILKILVSVYYLATIYPQLGYKKCFVGYQGLENLLTSIGSLVQTIPGTFELMISVGALLHKEWGFDNKKTNLSAGQVPQNTGIYG
jgi:hypothetical protein